MSDAEDEIENAMNDDDYVNLGVHNIDFQSSDTAGVDMVEGVKKGFKEHIQHEKLKRGDFVIVQVKVKRTHFTLQHRLTIHSPQMKMWT